MSEQDLDNELETPPEEGTPPEPENVRPTSDDTLRRELEDLRRQAEQFRLEAIRGQEWQKLASQVIEQSQAVRPSVEPAEPEPEIDENVRQYLDRKLRALVGEMGAVYQQDRATDLTYRASLERERAATRLVGFNDVASEIDEAIATLPPEARAMPGAYEQAYYLILGRKAAGLLAAPRSPGVAGSTRSASMHSPTSELSAEDRQWVRRAFRGKVDENDVSFFNRNEVSIGQFEEYQAKRAKRGGQR